MAQTASEALTPTRKRAFHCPHCGFGIERWLTDHTEYTCPECRTPYLVLVDEAANLAALFDRSARPLPEPLWLPRGSIRALIALAMTGSCWLLVLRGQDVPGALLGLLLTVVGFYFGFRTKAGTLSDAVYDPRARREQPLFLPAGVIRTLLIAGFLLAGGVLLHRGRLLGAGTYLEFFVVLGGLILGHAVGRAMRHTGHGRGRELFIHLKGLAGLGVAGALTVLFATGGYQQLPPLAVSLLCATVSFYFGTRS